MFSPYQHRIYVVGHDELKRIVFQPLTEQCGSRYSINFCDYGAELIGDLQATPTDDLPTLIMLDAGATQPDGLITLRRIKGDKRLRPIPTVLLVDADQPERVQQGYQLGANAIVARPTLPAQDCSTRSLERFSQVCHYWLRMVLHPA